jgi:ATP-independent RNA helicase DbpA
MPTDHNHSFSFSNLSLRQELLDNLVTLNYEQMTPIQAEALPVLLDNKDIIAQAKTGSGKTAAFSLTILNKLKVDHFCIQALILCPTRELAEQVAQSLRRYARLMHNVKVLNLSGGLSMRPQVDSLRHGAHIIVGTPGRVLKHLSEGNLSFTHLHTLVLDEADRMLDMGFFDDMKTIISTCPTPRQTMLFSATYPDAIKQIARQFMQKPQEIIIREVPEEMAIEQCFYEVQKSPDKLSLLKKLLLHYQPASALIFCNTIQQTDDLTEQLLKFGFSAMALNGDMDQAQRNQAIIRFANKSCAILVATDVAARGLDIKELPAVINYDLAFETDVHIHRIGRTSRAGHQGVAISITTPADAARIIAIEDHMQQPVPWCKASDLTGSEHKIVKPEMQTLRLAAGKRDKIRPGDILGALTKDAGLPSTAIGKIDITAMYSYIAIHHSYAEKALRHFQNGKLKGRKIPGATL